MVMGLSVDIGTVLHLSNCADRMTQGSSLRALSYSRLEDAFADSETLQ